ncbi:MAG: hypothetical protein AAF483_03520 [Planctomycetota bacterium]
MDESLRQVSEVDEKASAANQFSIVQLFRWTIVCAAFAALIGFVFSVLRKGDIAGVGIASLVPPVLSWGILLWHLISRGHRVAMLVHVIPPIVCVAIGIAFSRDDVTIFHMLTVSALTCAFTSFGSFPYGLYKDVERHARKKLGAWSYLILYVGSAAFFTCLLSAIASQLIYGVIYVNVILLWLPIVVWAAAYQAVATSTELRKMQAGIIALFPAVAGGLFTAIFFPFFLWLPPMDSPHSFYYWLPVPFAVVVASCVGIRTGPDARRKESDAEA